MILSGCFFKIHVFYFTERANYIIITQDMVVNLYHVYKIL